ncbi:MAG: hypothetical protein K5768_09885, partial [Firmicutes bacterium]|nr:hypothetical protein [Bacillota bacterium]
LYSMDPSFKENQESEFLNIKLSKRNPLSQNAKTASRIEFEIMSKYIKKAAVNADKAIKSGNISIKPYCSSGIKPCDYCPFGEICMFDAKLDGYRTETKPENAYEYMKKEVD